jgi:acyl carrier protein
MVPTAFVILDVFPLTPNGKIDRRALPAPDRSGLEEDYVAPRTPTEQTLADIWTNILGVEQFGIHDNFFELGGHSLLAMQVISRMRQAVGVELPVRNLFEAPNIAKLAEVVVAKQLEDVESEALDQILAEAEQLSDAEVARQLFAEEE